MATVFARIYPDMKTADAVRNRLYWQGFPRNAARVFATGDNAAGDIAARIARAGLPETDARELAAKATGGAVVLVLTATYKPLGAARLAREILADTGASDVDCAKGEYYVPDGPDHAPSVLKDHPRFLTLPIGDDEIPPGPITPRLGVPALLRKPRRNSTIPGDRRLSRLFWPMPLITRGRKARSVFARTRPLSHAFWPAPLLSTRPRRLSVIPNAGPVFSRVLGWPTLSPHRR